jgi:hypothetical protein
VLKAWFIGVVCLSVLGMASTAGAQSDEVFVDPDSPTGREYDIPLERVRRDAAPTAPAGSDTYRSRTAPLFGEGITTSEAPQRSVGGSAEDGVGGSAEDGGDGGTSAAREGGGEGSRSREQNRRSVPPAVEAAIQQPGTPGGSAGTALLLAAISGLVLAVGVVSGLLLRRRRS